MTSNFSSPVRVRFAPSPTGWMHLGNARIALLNALFAKKNNGTFVLRIEDTDQTRDVDPRGKKIMEHLAWLNITIDEGPFYQSERNDLYQKYLERLIAQGLVYRSFETNEELELKRQRQLARGLPPKYDRAALKLSPAEIEQNLAAGKPFIWRLKLPDGSVTIQDIAHGTMTFDLNNFSDVALTRQDGTCTFLFANCVDDIEMKISHVLRGADHLTNTAIQAAMYDMLGAPQPIFYHMPLVCNAEGKKISKRDFGASLDDFKKSGFLTEGLCNYLAIIGGTFVNEIMDFDELARAIHFDESSPKGTVHFDLEKLRWINHKWIGRLPVAEIAKRSMPLFTAAYPDATITQELLERLITPIRGDLTTLEDAVLMLKFFFAKPEIDTAILAEHGLEKYRDFFTAVLAQPARDEQALLASIKSLCKEQKKPLGELFALVRIALTGNAQGIGVGDLLTMLGLEEARRRMMVLVG